jgi:hypothetical protein
MALSRSKAKEASRSNSVDENLERPIDTLDRGVRRL